MSLLNTTNDGLPNVLNVLCKAVSLEGQIEKSKLAEICSTREEKSEEQIRQSILRWTQLGLFSDDDGKISFSATAEAELGSSKKPEVVSKKMPSIARHLVFRNDNNENFWDAEKSKAADLTRALAWTLAQDIYHFSFRTPQEIEATEIRQVADQSKRMFQNYTRVNGLRFWARFLGFTYASKETMIDPTQAVKDECRRIFKTSKDYTASEFVELLASRIPVLDGGTYRQRVEGILDPQHWQKPSIEQMLSTSLSRALWRLELAGIIELESRADAHSNRVLQRQHGQELQSFTHVVYRGGL